MKITRKVFKALVAAVGFVVVLLMWLIWECVE